ncbi:Cpn60 TCP1 domain containing protein [Trichuris trichiura]|uniref:Cpn60 TCP1 domain containing protein n=1 Tax=Trichuris trichiura TaxID=36087 RepID=A0A077Z9B0_TRITR|nr:Cpn60 TCP1 domain containing protein [Trichuris trichiura]
MKNISVIRRIRRTDSDRLAKLAGATVAHDPVDLTERDVGTKASELYAETIGAEYFTFVINDEDTEACILLPRNPNKDILMEMDRNLQDALHVVGNVFLNPKVLLGGGGAIEIAFAQFRTPILLLRVDEILNGLQKKRTLINLSRINGI